MKRLTLVIILLTAAAALSAAELRVGEDLKSSMWDFTAGQWLYLGHAEENYLHDGLVFRAGAELSVTRTAHGRSGRICRVSTCLCAQVSYWKHGYSVAVGPLAGIALSGLGHMEKACFEGVFGGRVSMHVSLGKVLGLVADLDVSYRDKMQVVASVGFSAALGL